MAEMAPSTVPVSYEAPGPSALCTPRRDAFSRGAPDTLPTCSPADQHKQVGKRRLSQVRTRPLALDEAGRAGRAHVRPSGLSDHRAARPSLIRASLGEGGACGGLSPARQGPLAGRGPPPPPVGVSAPHVRPGEGAEPTRSAKPPARLQELRRPCASWPLHSATGVT